MNMSERIALAITSSGKLPRDLAKEIGISVARISQLKAGLGGIKAENLFAFARSTGFSPQWLAEGVGEQKQSEAARANHAVISFYKKPGDDGLSINGYQTITLDKVWLKSLGLDEPSLKFVRSPDDTMEPTLHEGDILLIDEGQTDPVDGAIYVLLRMDGETIIKRLSRTMTSGWIIRSDHQDKRHYPDEVVSESEISNLRIAGRVVWHGGAL